MGVHGYNSEPASQSAAEAEYTMWQLANQVIPLGLQDLTATNLFTNCEHLTVSERSDDCSRVFMTSLVLGAVCSGVVQSGRQCLLSQWDVSMGTGWFVAWLVGCASDCGMMGGGRFPPHPAGVINR